MQFSQGVYRFKPDGSDFEYMTGSTNNTWGLGFSGDVRRVRIDGEQRSELLRGDPQPLLRRRRGAADAAGGGRGAGRATRARPQFYAVHPRRRTSGRWTCSAATPPAAGHYLYTARAFPKEYWNRDRVHHRADRAPGRPGDHREAGRRLRDARRLEPAVRRRGMGRARCTRRSGRTARCGSPTGTTSSPSTTRRRRATATASGNAYETPLRDQHRAAASTASSTSDAPPAEEAVAVEDRSRRAARGAGVRQHVLAAARAAPARRARAEGRRAAAARAGAQHGGRRDRHQRRRVARAVDAARTRRARRA